MSENRKNYGMELVLDLHDCDVSKFTKYEIDVFFRGLAAVTDMELCKRYWWTMDDCPDEWKELPHLNGISAVQFISTSNFTLHVLTDLKAAYLNIFTCKDFDTDAAESYAKNFFDGTVANSQVIVRK